MEYILHLLILISFYTLLAQSLNLCAGLSGLISLTHAGFYGIGAYTTAILSTQYGFPFLLNLPIALLLCGVIAFIISFIAVRTVDDYFIICTLGLQVIIFSVMNNWMSVTDGPLGIPGIPPINFFGYAINSRLSFLILSVIIVAISWGVLRNLADSGFGRILIALSQDEIYTQSIGKNVYQAKVIAFTLSGVLAAIPGTLYAHYITYINPGSFTVSESIYILSIVIIGGMGNFRGSFVAATILVLLPELLRFLSIPSVYAANLRQIIYGFLLIVLMVTRRKITR